MRLALGLSLTDLGVGVLGWKPWTSVLPQDALPGAQRKGKEKEKVDGEYLDGFSSPFIVFLYVFIDIACIALIICSMEYYMALPQVELALAFFL